LSLNSDELIRIIKRAAVEAVMAHDPMCMKIGEVVSVTPLAIRIGQKITIPASQLLTTSAVRDHTLPLSREGESKQQYRAHTGLQQGEKVLLLRCDGGQKFIVLDRLEEVQND